MIGLFFLFIENISMNAKVFSLKLLEYTQTVKYITTEDWDDYNEVFTMLYIKNSLVFMKQKHIKPLGSVMRIFSKWIRFPIPDKEPPGVRTFSTILIKINGKIEQRTTRWLKEQCQDLRMMFGEMPAVQLFIMYGPGFQYAHHLSVNP